MGEFSSQYTTSLVLNVCYFVWVQAYLCILDSWVSSSSISWRDCGYNDLLFLQVLVFPMNIHGYAYHLIGGMVSKFLWWVQ